MNSIKHELMLEIENEIRQEREKERQQEDFLMREKLKKELRSQIEDAVKLKLKEEEQYKDCYGQIVAMDKVGGLKRKIRSYRRWVGTSGILGRNKEYMDIIRREEFKFPFLRDETVEEALMHAYNVGIEKERLALEKASQEDMESEKERAKTREAYLKSIEEDAKRHAVKEKMKRIAARAMWIEEEDALMRSLERCETPEDIKSCQNVIRDTQSKLSRWEIETLSSEELTLLSEMEVL